MMAVHDEEGPPGPESDRARWRTGSVDLTWPHGASRSSPYKSRLIGNGGRSAGRGGLEQWEMGGLGRPGGPLALLGPFYGSSGPSEGRCACPRRPRHGGRAERSLVGYPHALKTEAFAGLGNLM